MMCAGHSFSSKRINGSRLVFVKFQPTLTRRTWCLKEALQTDFVLPALISFTCAWRLPKHVNIFLAVEIQVQNILIFLVVFKNSIKDQLFTNKAFTVRKSGRFF